MFTNFHFKNSHSRQILALKLEKCVPDVFAANLGRYSSLFCKKHAFKNHKKACDMTAINKDLNFLTAININPEKSDIAPTLSSAVNRKREETKRASDNLDAKSMRSVRSLAPDLISSSKPPRDRDRTSRISRESIMSNLKELPRDKEEIKISEKIPETVEFDAYV